jgi:hypothetical protein
MTKYNVTVERELVVFANSPSEAETKALAYLASVSTEQPAARPIKVVEVVPLPADGASANGVSGPAREAKESESKP